MGNGSAGVMGSMPGRQWCELHRKKVFSYFVGDMQMLQHTILGRTLVPFETAKTDVQKSGSDKFSVGVRN